MKQKFKGLIGTLIFALVVASALLVVQWYQVYSLTSALREDAYVVATNEVSKNLLKLEIPEKSIYDLTKVPEGEPVFYRRNHYYVGQGKDEIEGVFPFFINDANEVMIVDDSAVLITDKFEEVETFKEMFVSDGLSFNYDKSQADDDTFLFLKLQNGLFMNAQGIHFSSLTTDKLLRMNSIINFTKDMITYYFPSHENTLIYGQITDTDQLMVTIGDKKLSYEQLLAALNIKGAVNIDAPEGEEGKEPDYIEEGSEYGKEDAPMSEQELIDQLIKDMEDGIDPNAAEKGNKDKDSAGGGSSSKPGSSGGSGGSSGGSQGAQDGTGEEGPADGEQGDGGEGESSGSGSGSGSGEGTSGGEGEGESGEPGEPEWMKPTITFDEWLTDVYSVSNSVTLVDPSVSFRRVVISLYWQPEDVKGEPKPDSNNPNNYKIGFRKTYKSNGEFTVDNLPPDTWIYAKATIYYYDKNGKTQHEEFYDGFDQRFHTASLDTVDDIYVQLNNPANVTYQQHSISLYDFAVSGENKYVVDKISKVKVKLYQLDDNGNKTDTTYEIFMNLSDAKKNYFYPENLSSIPVWTSDSKQQYLPSNTNFYYEVELLDSFGSKFTHLVDGYMANTATDANKSLSQNTQSGNYYVPSGYTQTAKTTPTVSMAQRSFTDKTKNINRAAFDITVSDPDKAIVNPDNYVIKLYDETLGEYVSFALNKADESDKTKWTDTKKLTDFMSDENGLITDEAKRFEFWGLTAGHIYRAEISGSYDINDKNGTKNEILATTRFTTVSMSAFGRVSYIFNSEHVFTNIDPDGSVLDEPSKYESATAQKVSMQIDFSQVSELDLIDIYYDRVEFDITKQSDQTSILKGKLTKQAMQSVSVTGNGTGNTSVEFEVDANTLFGDNVTGLNGYRPKVFVRTDDFAGTKTLWDIFSSNAYNGTIVFYFEDAMSDAKGSLEPITSYRIDTQSYAVQGAADEDHDITSRAATFRRYDFTTLKRMPYVTIDDALLVSDYIRFTGIEIHDYDHAIEDSKVNAGIAGFQLKKEDIDYATKNGGYINELIYNHLTKGQTYIFSITPDRIKRSASGLNTLENETLYQFQFVAGSGLSGKITLASISFPLIPREGDPADSMELLSDYSLYDASNVAVGPSSSIDATMYPNDSGAISAGTIVDTGNLAPGNMVISPLISVEAGKYIYLNGLRETPASASYVMFYDDYGNVVTIDTYEWNGLETARTTGTSTGNRYTNRLNVYGGQVLLQVPSRATQMRFAMYGYGNNASGHFPNYATAGCYDISKAGGIIHLGEGGDPLTVALANQKDTYGFPVSPGEVYAIPDAKNGILITYYNEGTVIGSYNSYDNATSVSSAASSAYAGQVFVVPANATSMKISFAQTSTNYTKIASAHLVKINLEVLEWLKTKDLSRFASAVSISVYDPLNNLVGSPRNPNTNLVQAYLRVYKNGVPLKDSDYPLTQETVDNMGLKVVSQNGTLVTQNLMGYMCNFMADVNQSYDLELYVIYKDGQEIVLDRVNFKTFKALEILDDRSDVGKLMRYPNADFLVVDDIMLRAGERWFYGSEQNCFLGSIDFQGYTLKGSTSASGGYYGMNTLGPSGVIKNLVFDFTINAMNNRTAMNDIHALTYRNQGTLRNVVVKLNLGQGMYRKTYSSSLARYNSGLIENVTLELSGNSTNYVGGYFGGLVYENSGNIHNVLVYSPVALSATTGVYMGSTSGSIVNNYVGYISATGSGSINNALVVGNLAVEDFQESGEIGYDSLTAGSRSQQVHNSVTVGDIQKVVWNEDGTRSASPYLKYGPVAAGTADNLKTYTSNNYYFSPNGYTYERTAKGIMSRIEEAALLQDPSLYNKSVNVDEAFVMSDVDEGYYPRIDMESEKLLFAQPHVSLASTNVDNSIRYLTTVIKEQYEIGDKLPDGSIATEDYAIITLSFVNRLNRPISNLQIEGLTVSAVEGTEYEQEAVDGQYKVTVKVTPDNLYRKQYLINSFNYNDYYLNEVKDREVNVMFSKPIFQNTWIDETGRTFMNDMAGCYRLAEDIDMSLYFETLRPMAAKAMNNNVAFSGNFDGRGYSLKNFEFTTTPYLIKSTSDAEIMNLRVENMKINNNGVNYANVGLVGSAENGTKIHDVQIINAEINGIYTNGGSLAGKCVRSDIYDCVINGLKMNTSANAKTMSVGGLVGNVATSNIDNCFARNIDIQVKTGTDIQGTGGLVGYMASASYIRNVYTHGSVESEFIRTGGIIGYNNGFLINSWSKVNVSSTSQYIGGISGILDSSARLSNTLALGDVFTTTSDTTFNRINGGFYSTATNVARAYASDQQMMNSQVTTQLYDATGLLTKENLKSIQVYYNSCNIGELFDYSDIDKGYLPILYNKKGTEILPEQTVGIVAVPEKLEFTAEGTAEYAIYNIEESRPGKWDGTNSSAVYSETNPATWEGAYDGYELDVKLIFELESLNQENYASNYAGLLGANYEKISIENLALTGITPAVTFENGKTYLTFSGLKATKYMDSYRVVIETANGRESTSLSFKDKQGNDTILYHHIFRVRRNETIANSPILHGDGRDYNCWQDLMAVYGKNYDNFMVMADLNFNGLTKNDILFELKIGRLEGSKGATEFANHKMGYDYLCEDFEDHEETARYWKIQNLTYSETSKQGITWFYDIQSSLSRLEFCNINWTSTPSGSYAAIIRKMTGKMSYVDIRNLDINYGFATSYIGFIGFNVGNIEYVRGRNIKVTSAQKKPDASITYVGGIVANSNSMVENVHIRGKLSNPTDVTTSGYTVQGQYINVNKTNSSYSGGIAGLLNGTGGRYLYAENVYVTGNYYTGALAGYNYNYYSTYSVYTTANHTADQEGVGANEDPLMLGKATNCYAEGSYYVGALYGFGGYQKYLLGRDNYVKAYQGAGGLEGHSYGTSYSYAYDTDVVATNNRAGGIAAYGMSSTTSSYNTVQGCNVHSLTNAGGISGSTSTINQGYSVVKDSAIWAESNAGGIAAQWTGNSSNYASYYNLVTRTIVGRTNTHHPNVEKNSDGTYTLSMIAEPGAATNYAGGLYGQTYGMYFYQSVVDDSVTIYGNDYVGGLYGRGGAGSSYRLEIAPTIHSSGTYSGTLAGELVGYAEAVAGPNILSVPVTKFNKVILAGSVEGASSVGAVAGRFEVGNRPQDPDTGAYIADEDTGYTPYMNRANYGQFILAQSSVKVTGSSTYLGLLASNIKESSTEGINYLYIFDGMVLGNNKIRNIDSSAYMTQGNVVYYVRKDTVNVTEPKLVTRDNLQNAYLYYDTLANNGLYLSEYTSNNTNYYRYFDTQENGAYVSNATEAVHGILKDGATPGRFPYINIGSGRNHVITADQDGIYLPVEASTTNLMMMTMYDPEEIYTKVSVYASGADTLNIEMPEELFNRYPMAKYTVYDSLGRSLVKEAELNSKVLTLPYDYTSLFSFELILEEGESKIYAVSPEMAANSVMLYGDHAYFIKSDGIYSDNGIGKAPVKVLSGEFVHMYQGKATSTDGKIYDLSGSVSANVRTVAAPLDRAVPLYVSNYDSIRLETYKNYTVRNSVSLPLRLFVKSGQLFSADPSLDQDYGQNFTAFVADYYSNSGSAIQYFSVLSGTHTIENYMTAIKWPSDVKNSSIATMADNVNANVPYVLVRYFDNTVACFNYQTGTLIFTDNSEKMSVDFTTYATMWLESFSANLNTSNAYMSANDLITDITENPVDNNLLAGIVNGQGTNEAGADSSSSMGIMIAGTSTEAGAPIEGVSSQFRPGEDAKEMTSSSATAGPVESGEDETDAITSSTSEKPSVVATESSGSVGGKETSVAEAGNKEESEKSANFPAENSKDAYITMATGNGYVVYKIEDLLSSNGGKVLSMNEKIELLKQVGLYSSFDLQSLKIENNSQRTGIALVGISVAAISALIGVLYYRKRVISKY